VTITWELLQQVKSLDGVELRSRYEPAQMTLFAAGITCLAMTRCISM
jgi:hypothetical protein